MNKNSNIDVINKISVIKEYCSELEKKILAQNNSIINCKNGQVLFYQDYPVNGVYIIIKGKVKLWKNGINTHQQIIRFSKVGDVLGYRSCMENSTYKLSVTAMQDTQVCFIEKNIFFETLKNNHQFHFKILLQYVNNLKDTETRLRDMAEMNVREKIAEALIILKKAFGLKKDNKTLDVQLSRKDVAAVAGISTDRAIKQLSIFRNEHLIATNGKHITLLDLQKLKEILIDYSDN